MMRTATPGSTVVMITTLGVACQELKTIKLAIRFAKTAIASREAIARNSITSLPIIIVIAFVDHP